ncbi:MAG: cytochrome b/b6 domain-containing protein [Casimicrobiaceae bacterium]
MNEALRLDPAVRGSSYARHALPVRIMHWINVVALTILLMSGLQIFNAHPALYWGKSSYTGNPPLLRMSAAQGAGDQVIGTTEIGGRTFDTTGVLGASRDRNGAWAARGFPWWITIPDNQWLSMARSWHFFFVWVLVLNGLAYLGYSIASRHLKRDLVPDGRDWRSIGQSIADHLRFRHPTGEAATRYNVLQKLAYLVVVFVLLPLIVLMGLAMSPWLDGIPTGWVDVFGGRQSARTLHFVIAWLLVAFVLIHVFEVLVSGAWNHLRSMVTGRFVVPEEKSHE